MNEIGKFHCGQKVTYNEKEYVIVARVFEEEPCYYLGRDLYSKGDIKIKESELCKQAKN